MNLRDLLNSVLIVLFLTSCFKKEVTAPVVSKSESETQTLVPAKNEIPEKKVQIGYLNKEQREAIYFAASLEREGLKLITKNNGFDKGTLFSILSYIFETDAGVKKMFPANIECSRFRIEKKINTLFVYKTCQKPETLVVEVKSTMNGLQLEVDFKTREWGYVVGSSVSLTGGDIRCQLSMKDKKLNMMSCQNWTYLVSGDHLSSTEIRLRDFVFERANPLQFQMRGGFYKDLVENKKIAITIPIAGQIKMIEKEIEVIDDFAEKPKPVEVPKAQVTGPSAAPEKLKPIIIGGPNGQKENNEKSEQEKRRRYEETGESEAPSADNSQRHPTPQQEGQSPEGGQEINDQKPEQSEAEKQREIEENTIRDENNGGVPRNSPVETGPNGLPKTNNRGR